MKTIATLALIMALLGFTAVNASAEIFTLWQYFPKTVNGTDGFYAASYSSGTVTNLTHTDSVDYSFSSDGAGTAPVVERSATEPWLFLQPSGTEAAIYYGLPDKTYSLDVSGQFELADAATSAHVSIVIALVSNPSSYTSLFSDDLNSGNPTTTFDLTSVVVDTTHALVFAVDQGNGDAQAYLEGTINDNVPVPASVLLLGSGLLGLGGWRRLKRS